MGVLPVSKKEGKRKGKNGIGPRMKNGRANLKQNEAFTNGGFSISSTHGNWVREIAAKVSYSQPY